MQLVTYRQVSHTNSLTGLLVKNRVYDLSTAGKALRSNSLPADMIDLPVSGLEPVEAVQHAILAGESNLSGYAIDDLDLLQPVSTPRMVIAPGTTTRRSKPVQ